MARPKKERGIEQTLRDLDIPTDVTPAEAATAAAEEASEEHDDEEEISEEDEERLSQQQDGISMSDDLEDGDDEEEEREERPRGKFVAEDVPLPSVTKPPKIDPALVPNPSVGRPRRGKPPEKPRGVQMSKSILDMVPGAEKVMVEKRLEGKKWFVAEYQRDDLSSFANFEAFLTRYVKPKHGAGEYDLTGIDGRGNRHFLGQVRLLEDGTVRNSPESAALQLVERMMTEQRERDEKWMQQQQRMGNHDPLQLLAGVMNLKKQLEGETSGGMSDVFKTMLETNKESGNTALTMMMAMMQQQSQMMMALLTKPKEEDPIMKLLLTKLLSEGGLGGGGSAMPPPPPPPPAPSLDVAELLTAVAGLVSTLSGGGGEDEFKEYLKQKELARQSDNLGMKDILQLVLDAKNGGGQAGSGGFKETIDNLAAVMNIAQNISRQSEPGASAGFFDALAALFSNRDFAGAAAQAVRLKMDAKAGTTEARLQAEAQRLQMERRLIEQEKARLLAAGGTSQNAALPQQHVAPTAAAPQQHVQNTSQPQIRPQVTQEQMQAAAQREIERTGKIPELPPLTYEHINNIMTAKDDAERVGKTVGLLIYFAEFDDWKPFSERLLKMVRDGNRARATEYLHAFFSGLAELGLFPAQNVQPLLEILNEHFVAVQEQFAEFTASDEQEAGLTGEQLMSPPEEGAAAE